MNLRFAFRDERGIRASITRHQHRNARMAERQIIYTRVCEIVAKSLDADPDKLIEATNLAADLGADSLDAIDLTMDLEEEFDVEFSDALLEESKTIGQLVDAICRQKALAA